MTPSPTKEAIERLTEVAQNGLIQYQWRKDIATLLASHDKLVEGLKEMVLTMDAQVRVGIRWDPQTVADTHALLKELGQ